MRHLRLFVVVAALVMASMNWVETRQGGGRVAIDPDDIGGTVTGANGPEAGVWVIAETTSLPTKFVRIVATDDRGRYVVPDLPRGEYDIWARGYGLVDSPRQKAKPGQSLDLKAVPAPNAAAAAQYYPASYWFAISDRPPGGCLACHQLGNLATRTIPKSILQKSTSSLEAWDNRVKAGPEGPDMSANFLKMGAARKAFADWTDRVAAGELPRTTPRRPMGVERNLVTTMWDWGQKVSGRNDVVAADLRNPRINANGLVYMDSRTDDVLAALDPNEHRATIIKVPSKAPEKYGKTPWSPYWGDEPIWKRRAEPRSIAMDSHANVWFTAIERENPSPAAQPAWCTSPENRYAKHYPIPRIVSRTSGPPRQAILYEPKNKQFTPIPDVCTTLDHNQFGPDDNLYFGAAGVVFWLDTEKFLKTRNPEESQGWCPAVVDTNNDGKITEWTEPGAPIDPAKDHRVDIGCYQVTVDHNNRNGVAWCGDEGRLTRIEKGPSPPQSCRAQVFRPPVVSNPALGGGAEATIDSNGVVWTVWRGSQHFTAFDYRKCKTTGGVGAATGDNCKEGWTVYYKGGPTFRGTDVEADMTYLPQVDLHDALGLGKDMPMYGTVNADMIAVLDPKTKQFYELRVPYPMGFFSRSANGRIDEPRAGWKGKGIWTSFSTYTPWHDEGVGIEGNGNKAVKFQMRPNPLAK